MTQTAAQGGTYHAIDMGISDITPVGQIHSTQMLMGEFANIFTVEKTVKLTDGAAQHQQQVLPSGYKSFAASDRGWILGYEDGTFRPANFITRSETVTLINRVLERHADKAYIDANASALKQYTDLNTDNWAYYEIIEASNTHTYQLSPQESWRGLGDAI